MFIKALQIMLKKDSARQPKQLKDCYQLVKIKKSDLINEG